jgi:hypothetical protein
VCHTQQPEGYALFPACEMTPTYTLYAHPSHTHSRTPPSRRHQANFGKPRTEFDFEARDATKVYEEYQDAGARLNALKEKGVEKQVRPRSCLESRGSRPDWGCDGCDGVRRGEGGVERGAGGRAKGEGGDGGSMHEMGASGPGGNQGPPRLRRRLFRQRAKRARAPPSPAPVWLGIRACVDLCAVCRCHPHAPIAAG